MSTAFSLVVYVNPPHARPNRPSTIRMTPSVLLTAAPFGSDYIKSEETHPRPRVRRTDLIVSTSPIRVPSDRASFELCPHSFSAWPSAFKSGLLATLPAFSFTLPLVSQGAGSPLPAPTQLPCTTIGQLQIGRAHV